MLRDLVITLAVALLVPVTGIADQDGTLESLSGKR